MIIAHGAGNLIMRTRISNASANDYQVNYTWDTANRLVEVQDFNNAGTLTQQINYTYDVYGRLIERVDDVVGGSTTTVHYVWDGDGMALAFDGNDNLTTRYLNGPNTSAYDQFYTTLAEEDVTTPTQQGATTWDYLDDQGSVVDVANSSGAIIDHIQYSATGAVFSESNPSITHIGSFQGGYLDSATGLEKFGVRWEVMADAFWASQDPIDFSGGSMNLTEAVGNDAANERDPSGLACDPDEDRDARLPNSFGGEGVEFGAQSGPVRIIGIVGNGQGATAQGTGVASMVNGVAKNIRKQEGSRPSMGIYGSSGGSDTVAKGGNNNKTVGDIVNDEVRRIQALQAGLGDCDTVRVAIIGYSYGADKAIRVAAALQSRIKALNLKAQVHLRTVDAINPASAPPPGQPLGASATTTGAGAGLASNENFYQTGDKGFFVDANNKQIPLNGGIIDPANTHNINVTTQVNEAERRGRMRHARVSDIIIRNVVDSLKAAK